ncbi:MAG TPA: transglutaminase domain-containing protein [Thermoguttaceae bacterium]|nr:transglutaminase domain-containing protein [Thermoguttaceae bacterium]
MPEESAVRKKHALSSLFLPLVLFTLTASSAWAQFKEGGSTPGELELGEAKTQRWKIGLMLTAVGGPCAGITGYVPIPVDWPEQQVREVEDDITPTARVSYRTVDGTMKLMVIKIARLPAGETAKAIVTFDVTHRPQLPPDKTDQYVLPDVKKLPRDVRRYLRPSPKIESKDVKIRDAAKEINFDQETAWEKVEAIYDWVRDKVEYQRGPQKSAVETLKARKADCEGMTALFIAICRAKDIPARTIWVQGHCYPEFYLADKDGKGHWFPCQVSGDRAMGGIPETRPIWQKGDDFALPDQRGKRVHYLPERVSGSNSKGKPRARFVREAVGVK